MLKLFCKETGCLQVFNMIEKLEECIYLKDKMNEDSVTLFFEDEEQCNKAYVCLQSAYKAAYIDGEIKDILTLIENEGIECHFSEFKSDPLVAMLGMDKDRLEEILFGYDSNEDLKERKKKAQKLLKYKLKNYIEMPNRIIEILNTKHEIKDGELWIYALVNRFHVFDQSIEEVFIGKYKDLALEEQASKMWRIYKNSLFDESNTRYFSLISSEEFLKEYTEKYYADIKWSIEAKKEEKERDRIATEKFLDMLDH